MTAPGGPATPPARTGVPPAQELRFAVVLNGGVSLAVWMGGAVHEIDQVTRDRSGAGPSTAYGALLNRLGVDKARADVITGSSAGGINGALLALSQTNRNSPGLTMLRDLWAEEGQIDRLLTKPFTGEPTSLLQGDGYFLPRLQEAFRRMAQDWSSHPSAERPVDLSITTSLLRGVPTETVDGLGQTLTQSIHEARFEFRRGPTAPPGRPGTRAVDPFDDESIARTVEQLALAARSTASFPVAFEPSFIPVAGRQGAAAGRPDMSDVVSWRAPGDRQASYADSGVWQEQAGARVRDASRYGVDGGLLVNTPTRAALRAIDEMPAEADVRRVLLLVYPHAPRPGEDRPDELDRPPTAAAAAAGLVAARGSQSSRTFVEEVEEHNRRAGSVRATRGDVLGALEGSGHEHGPSGALFALADELFPHYWDLRVRRSARDLVDRFPPVPGMTWSRLRAVVEQAQWSYADVGAPAAPWLPYVPAGWRWWAPGADPDSPEPPVADAQGWGEDTAGWGWGLGTVDRVANAVLELVQRLAARTGPETAEMVQSLREELHDCRQRVREQRDELDRRLDARLVTELGVGREGRPHVGGAAGYWTARLDGYARLMTGGAPWSEPAGVTPEIGVAVRRAALGVAEIAAAAIALVSSRAVDPGEDAVLQAWDRMLSQPRLPGEPLDEGLRLLGRLVAFEVVTSCIGEEPGETDAPVTLVQLSLHAEHGFARRSTDPDAKVGGYSLARFSGFLKQSWRVNDWIWGRLDAAGILARTLCEPERVSKAVEARAPQLFAADRHTAANAWLEDLTVDLFGVPSEELPPPVAAARARAHDDLCDCLDDGAARGGRLSGTLGGAGARREVDNPRPPVPHPADGATAPGPGALRALADFVSWAVHASVILDELPALARSIRYDAARGGNPRSNGELFLRNHARLLDEVTTAAELPPRERLVLAVRALAAFDEAGVGREDLGSEGSSDQMIGTAASAAAAGVTVLDSPRLGVGAAKPVTKALRGAFMLPYWTVVGLARGTSMARWLAVLALATGGAAVALSLLTGGPAWLTALGAVLLLTALGYGALRSRSLLHGLVLLSPVLPLLAIAVQRLRADETRTPAVVTLLLVAAVVGGLILLGLLPHPVRTPAALAADLALRLGRASGMPSPRPEHRRRFVVSVWVVLLVLTVGLGWAVGSLADDLARFVDEVSVRLSTADPAMVAVWLLVVLALLVGVAGVGAWFGGRMFRRYGPAAPGDDTAVAGGWVLHDAVDPAATSAGWAWVYGVGYALVAVLVANGAWAAAWGRWVAFTAAVICLALLVAAVVTPWRARSRVERALVATVPADVVDSQERERLMLESVERSGDRFAFLLVPDADRLRLSPAARQLAVTGRRSGPPVSRTLRG